MECEKTGFPVDTGLVVRNLVAIITGQSRFKTVSSLPAAKLKNAWEESQEAMRFALNFVRANGDVDSIALLSSPFILVTLAVYGYENEHTISQSAEERLRQWFHLANAKGRYSRGSSETALDRDLAVIEREASVESLLKQLRSQVGRFEIESEDLIGKNQRSSLFKAMFLAFRDSGAKDWDSHLKISVKHSGSTHKLQFHHVVPKAVIKSKYETRLVNDISNLAFIGGKTNRRISASEPEKYLKRMLDEGKAALLKAQCIPLDEDLFRVDAYPQFLEARRALIAARLNQYIGPV